MFELLYSTLPISTSSEKLQETFLWISLILISMIFFISFGDLVEKGDIGIQNLSYLIYLYFLV